MALTRNKPRVYSNLVRRNSLQLAAATTVWEGSAVGIDASTGRVRPVVAGDLFAGFAARDDTSTRDVTGATPTSAQLVAEGEVLLTVSGVTATSIGASVFATDDDTFALTGSTLVGEVLRVPASGQAVVAFQGGIKRMSSTQVAAGQALVSGGGNVEATPAKVAALSGRASVLATRCLIGHRGVGGLAPGTPASPGADMRGSIGTMPENTMSAYRQAFNAGVRVFEIDVWTTGGYIMHDQDPRRVCTAAVATDITALTLAQFKALSVNASTWLGPGYADEAPPTLREVLAEFGNQALLICEAKDAGGGLAIAAGFAEFNIAKDMGMCGAFGAAYFAAVKAAGYSCLLYGSSPSSTTPAAVVATGAIGYGTNSKWTAAEVAEYQAAGLLCIANLSEHRRWERDQQWSVGVNAIFADDLALFDVGLITSGFGVGGRWPAGLIGYGASIAEGGRGALTLAGGWGIDAKSSSPNTALMGHLCPLPPYYEFTFYATITSYGASTSGFYLFVCARDDAKINNASTAFRDSYLLYCRNNKVMEGYIVTDATTSPSSIATATVTDSGGTPTEILNDRCQYRLQVTPTQVILTNITMGNVSLTITDSTYRPAAGYIHMGRTNATFTTDTWVRVS